MRLFLLLSTAGTLALALSAAASAPTQTPPGKGEGCHAGGPGVAASTKVEEVPGLLAHLGSGGYAAEGVSDAARPYLRAGRAPVSHLRLAQRRAQLQGGATAPARLRPVQVGRGLGAGAEPSITPSTPRRRPEARAVALKAQALSGGLSEKAKAQIAAQIVRYPRKARRQGSGERQQGLRRRHGAPRGPLPRRRRHRGGDRQRPPDRVGQGVEREAVRGGQRAGPGSAASGAGAGPQPRLHPGHPPLHPPDGVVARARQGGPLRRAHGETGAGRRAPDPHAQPPLVPLGTLRRRRPRQHRRRPRRRRDRAQC